MRNIGTLTSVYIHLSCKDHVLSVLEYVSILLIELERKMDFKDFFN